MSTRYSFLPFILDKVLVLLDLYFATTEIKVMTLPFVCITLPLFPCLSRKPSL